MNITDLNNSSTLAEAIKADIDRLPLIDERVSTIAYYADNQQIKGEAGAGKSVLASVVVDFLRTPPVNHHSIGVAAIYCNFKERDQQSPENLLAGCCVQLIQPSRNPFPEVFTDVYRKHDSGRTRPVWEDIVRIFEDSIKNLDTVYLVVDALDECSEDARKKLLDYFKSLPANIKLLVTTRHIAQITREFYDSPKVEIRADPIDLRKYITTRIAGNRKLEGYVLDDTSLKTHIRDKVTTKADKMFLAAKLHVDSLSTKTSIRMLKKALEDLSNDLSVLYNDAFSRIESQNQDDRKLAKKALRWVAYTYSPLTARALQEALAIELGDTDFDNEAITPIGLILDVCAGLLTLDKKNGTVRLVHYTAQDYFDTVQSTRFNNVHATIACDCVTYLSYDCFQHPKDPSGHGTEGSSEESSSGTLTPSIEFFSLRYASLFWAQHVKTANRDAHLSTKIHQFLAGNPRVILKEPWGYNKYDPRKILTDWLKPRHSLEIAASFGLCDELKGFYKDTVEVDALTDDLNLLHLAVYNDQASAIQVLLDHGADIERRDCYGLTPLHRAIDSIALEAATALVNRGADVMAEATKSGYSREPDYLTPISSFGGASPSQFLELLLGAGARIQTRDIFDMTPLMDILITMNDVQTAEKLFEQDSVEQPTKKEINSKALFYASKFGATKMVDMLLSYGADINSDDGHGQTALHIAMQKGNIDQVNQLLACGADFKSQGLVDKTPLDYAAERGNKDCILAVLRCGADVNRQDMLKETALHLASKKGNLAGIEVLLAHRANMEAQNFLGWTPLVFAVAMGNEDCVLTLLRNGANANAQDESGTTALHMASFAAFEAYLFDLLGVLSAKEAEEELKRRIEEEPEREIEERHEREFEITQLLGSLTDIEKLTEKMGLKAEERFEEVEKPEEERYKLEEKLEKLEEERYKLEEKLGVLERMTEEKQRLLQRKLDWMDWDDKLVENKKWKSVVKKQLRIEEVEEE
ncbi:MAG: hypothetical protein Q9188_007184 [Gyalolechia gomerana]